MTQAEAALQNPEVTTVPRRAGSARRTSHIDTTFCDDGRLLLTGAARDLRTPDAGDAVELASAQVRALLGPTRLLEELEVSPPTETSTLLGRLVGRGFRAEVDDAVPEHRALHSPLYLLLDDLPVAALISGYASLYALEGTPRPQREGNRSMGLQSDICSGWRSDGVLMRRVANGDMPITVGPLAPALEPPDDPLAWHPVPALGAHSMRRRRLIDVSRAEHGYHVDAMFRDSHVDAEGLETVLHEYELVMALDDSGTLVVSCEARPRVLPWPECPAAAASAGRLVGHAVSELRSLVRAEFRGTTTCTHLNDLLRSLADVELLVAVRR